MAISIDLFPARRMALEYSDSTLADSAAEVPFYKKMLDPGPYLR